MAIYTNLPLYKSLYDLLKYFFEISRKFQKDFRYTLGESIRNELVKMMTQLYRANATEDKIPYIERMRQDFEAIKIQIRILHDMKQMSLRQYTMISVEMDSISKQLVAWHKYLKKDCKTVNNQ